MAITAKPDKFEGHVRAWLAEQGDHGFLACARCRQMSVAGTSPGSSTTHLSASSADPRAAATLVGREIGDQSLVLGYTHAFVVTSSTFRVCRMTGFKERVKELVVEAPFADTSLHFVDLKQEHGHVARFLIVDLGDGRWVVDSLVVLKRNGSRAPFADGCDAFIAAFGDRAHRVDAPAM